ncbi:hypothetical protein [Polaromonas naphthalenivorans]|nr:hypothetical protein [Polaromonas naphthalenivorans]
MKIKIAPVHSIRNFGVAMPLSLMGFAGWRLNRNKALGVHRILRALPTKV